MTARCRKLSVIGVMVAVILLANTAMIAHWLYASGLVDLAHWMRQEYLTGTAIAVILALIWLTGDRGHRIGQGTTRCCRVCEEPIAAIGRYCPHCGSRT